MEYELIISDGFITHGPMCANVMRGASDTSVTRRKYLIAAGGASSITLAGCLGDDDDADDDPLGVDDDDDDPDDDDDDVPDFELGDKEASEDIEIDLWLSAAAAEDPIAAMVDEDFNPESDTITVNVDNPGNYEENFNALIQTVRAEEPPALVHINTAESLASWGAGAVQPVEPLIGHEIDVGEFLEPALAYTQFEDELWGLPLATSAVGGSYNVDAFEEAGLASHPDDVQLETWEDWQNAAEEIEDAGRVEHGFTWPTFSWFWETFFAMEDHVYVNNENGRAEPADEGRFDSEFGEDLFSWFWEMYDNEHYVYSDGWGDARTAYLDEIAGIELDSTAALGSLTAGAEEAGFEHGYCEVPSREGEDRHGYLIGGGALFVPQGVEGPQLEAAAEVLLWLAQPEQQARFHQETGYFPVTDGAFEITEEEGFYDDNPAWRTAFENFEATESTPATQGVLAIPHRQIRNEVDRGVERLLGGDPVSEVIEATNDDISARLEDRMRDDPRA